jgi:DNA-binding NarL/FixJ family response regulator
MITNELTFNKISILLVDDLPENLQLLSDLLIELGCIIRTVTSGRMALKTLKVKQPDLILLDINMPEMNGYQICSVIKADEELCHIPVIFISALDEVFDKVKAFNVGGVDYITKPFQVEEVIARVENALRLQQQIKQSQLRWQRETEEKINAYQLSERELEILKLYALNKQRGEIAQQLFISENTVKSHLKNVFTKLKINNRDQLIEKAYELGLLKS